MKPQLNDGGTAFPITLEQYDGAALRGMSLRDVFAGQALTGLLANPNWLPNNKQSELTFTQRYAEQAFLLADAMIAARNKTA